MKSSKFTRSSIIVFLVSSSIIFTSLAGTSTWKSKGAIKVKSSIVFDSSDIETLESKVSNLSNAVDSINLSANDSGQIVFTDSTGTETVIPYEKQLKTVVVHTSTNQGDTENNADNSRNIGKLPIGTELSVSFGFAAPTTNNVVHHLRITGGATYSADGSYAGAYAPTKVKVTSNADVVVRVYSSTDDKYKRQVAVATVSWIE